MTKEEFITYVKDLTITDPNQALLAISHAISGLNFQKTSGDFDRFAADYIDAFVERYSLPYPRRQALSNPEYLAKIVIAGAGVRQRNEIESLLDQYQEKTEGENFGFAVLNENERQAIRARLDEISNLVVASKVGEKKKEILLRKITNLRKVVELLKTPTERFFGFLTDLAFVSGEMAKSAKPAIDEFKDILRIVMRSRAKNEGISLPKPDEWPQLPGPEEFGE